MPISILFAAIFVIAAVAFVSGRRHSLAVVGGSIRQLHSLPGYYGWYNFAWCLLPALGVLLAWLIVQPMVVDAMVQSRLPEAVKTLSADRIALFMTDVRNLSTGNIVSQTPSPEALALAEFRNATVATGNIAMSLVVLALAALGFWWGRRPIAADFRARNKVERLVRIGMIVCSMIAILITAGIVLSLAFESYRFFTKVSIFEFLFGLDWSPQVAIREGQVGSSGAFGAVPVFAGTILIMLIAMAIAVPVGLFAAIFLSEYATPSARTVIKPLLEILAGIPTVVYGFFAALTVAPFFREAGSVVGLSVASESALAAGIVMGVMIIPFVSSLSDDVINSVPQSLRDGSYALGATRSETIRQVVLPAALPGIVGAVLLAISRAIGETMIVVMAAGFAANLTLNPLEAVTTVTVQIATLLVGDQEFDSPKTLAAFALGLLLFIITLCLNIIALRTVRKYREKYD
jgi:phosphate transport system permease protein